MIHNFNGSLYMTSRFGRVVLMWLRFLKAHHSDYRYITICNDQYITICNDQYITICNDQYITICNDQVQSLPDDSDVSHLLPTLDVSEDDELGPQEDVPSLESDPQLPNTQSIVPSSCADDTEINQIL